jgi:co-chaperonin GroES (HSP10)
MRNVEVGASATVYFDVRDADNVNPALSEAGGQPQTSLNGAAFSDNGISTLSAIGYGRYSATLNTSLLSVAEGDVILTRYKGAGTSETRGDDFTVVSASGTLANDPISVACYGSLQSAEIYFSQQLNIPAWDDSSPAEKQKALVMATQTIDRLNFAGDKANTGQVLQFPRKNSYTDPVTTTVTNTYDDNVPEDIKIATYLIAYKFLDGYDPDIEGEMLEVEMSKYQSIQSYYQRDYIPEWKLAGIPSQKAWSYLKPYLRDPREIHLSRVS